MDSLVTFLNAENTLSLESTPKAIDSSHLREWWRGISIEKQEEICTIHNGFILDSLFNTTQIAYILMQLDPLHRKSPFIRYKTDSNDDGGNFSYVYNIHKIETTHERSGTFNFCSPVSYELQAHVISDNSRSRSYKGLELTLNKGCFQSFMDNFQALHTLSSQFLTFSSEEGLNTDTYNAMVKKLQHTNLYKSIKSYHIQDLLHRLVAITLIIYKKMTSVYLEQLNNVLIIPSQNPVCKGKQSKKLRMTEDDKENNSHQHNYSMSTKSSKNGFSSSSYSSDSSDPSPFKAKTIKLKAKDNLKPIKTHKADSILINKNLSLDDLNTRFGQLSFDEFKSNMIEETSINEDLNLTAVQNYSDFLVGNLEIDFCLADQYLVTDKKNRFKRIARQYINSNKQAAKGNFRSDRGQNTYVAVNSRRFKPKSSHKKVCDEDGNNVRSIPTLLKKTSIKSEPFYSIYEN